MDLPIQSIEALRAAGQEAAKAGGSVDASPYPRDGAHHAYWVVGYYWAAKKLEDLEPAMVALASSRADALPSGVTIAISTPGGVDLPRLVRGARVYMGGR